MPSGNRSSTGSRVLLAMAGLESGVLGGTFMLGWLALGSLFDGRSVWSVPNLFASTFYGEAALRRGFRWTTLSGLALHVFLSALAGLLFALSVSGVVNRGRVLLLGIAAGLAWYFVSLGFFWEHVNPMVSFYERGARMLLAHMGLGFFLGSVPKYRQALETPLS